MTAPPSPDAPWFYRHRAACIGGILFAGYALGFGVPSLGRTTRAPIWLALVLVVAGIAIRIAGSSYLGAAVVYRPSVVTDALFTSGPYRFTRNPLYLGLVLYALGLGLLGPPLAAAVIGLATLAFAYALIAVEEPRLRACFGDRFDAYARAVPRLFPSPVPRVPPSRVRPSIRMGVRAEAPLVALAAVSGAMLLAR